MENFEEPKRNIEKEKAEFVEAINRFVVEVIDADFDTEAVEALKRDITSGKLLAMGEYHGVKENPNIIYTLFKNFGFKVLGLEWNKKIESTLRHYMETGEIDFEKIRNESDGRVTAGHFALLKKILEEGELNKLICFDDSGAFGERDKNMAQNFANDFDPASPTLIVAGNAHTDMRPIRESDGTEHSSMVAELNGMQVNFVTGEVDYLSGKFFNMHPKDLGDEGEHIGKRARFYKNEDGMYIFELPVGTPAEVPNTTDIYIDD